MSECVRFYPVQKRLAVNSVRWIIGANKITYTYHDSTFERLFCQRNVSHTPTPTPTNHIQRYISAHHSITSPHHRTIGSHHIITSPITSPSHVLTSSHTFLHHTFSITSHQQMIVITSSRHFIVTSSHLHMIALDTTCTVSVDRAVAFLIFDMFCRFLNRAQSFCWNIFLDFVDWMSKFQKLFRKTSIFLFSFICYHWIVSVWASSK
jgi:hypothetical protein